MHGHQIPVDDIEEMVRDLDAREVANTDDHILRNYLITQSYWNLSDNVMGLVGGRDLVWPTFGAWASAQAGRHMRMESPSLARFAPRPAKQHIVEMLGRGNRRVFADIAPPFENFADFVQSSEADDLATYIDGQPEHVTEHIADVLDLDPRSVDDHEEGQRLMIMAFTQYFMAVHESDSDARAERIFVANCCVGLQEQKRVDCMLDHLLDVDTANTLAPWLAFPLLCGWWASHPFRWLAKLVSKTTLTPLRTLGETVNRIEREARIWQKCLIEERFTQVVGTRLLMHFELNDESLDIDDDVPRADAHQAFPAELAEFDTESPRFRAYLEEVLRWDRFPDSLEESAAHDWTQLDDRMNYILDLFRTRQQDESLATNPLAIDASTSSHPTHSP